MRSAAPNPKAACAASAVITGSLDDEYLDGDCFNVDCFNDSDFNAEGADSLIAEQSISYRPKGKSTAV
jgi:hypothetical protein